MLHAHSATKQQMCMRIQDLQEKESKIVSKCVLVDDENKQIPKHCETKIIAGNISKYMNMCGRNFMCPVVRQTFYFLNHNLNFPNLINVNMQTWLPMQKWQPGGVRCSMSGAGQTRGVPGMEKARCWRVERPHKSL